MRYSMQSLLVFMLVIMLSGCAGRSGPEGTNQDLSQYGEPIAVQKSIPFADRAGVRLEVKQQCRLETKTPMFIQQFAPEHKVNVQLVDDLKESDIDRKLQLEITKVHAPAGGGMFAGDMWMRVDGTLYEDGQEKAKVFVKRETTGGYWDEFKSTCAIVGRCTEAIGNDLANWLSNPEDGAYLGDFPRKYSNPNFHPGPGGPPGPTPPAPF